MTAARQISESHEASLQDVVDEVEQVKLTISQLGVEVQRMQVTVESIALTLGSILGEIRSLKEE